jgi:UDP-hydrolysing UDP-N-acetyl-D-glucosamine 2-epimerase
MLFNKRNVLKKICVVTAARSEYGYLKWLLKDIIKDTNLELQLIVTGGHLSKDQGYTVEEIYQDGFPIAALVDVDCNNTLKVALAQTMGRLALNFADVFDKLTPDILVVLGDRYELLPICSTAFVMGIPIAHISGGDITEGVIDDDIRNVVAMLASYHFPGTYESAKNIIRMRNSDKNIFVVGELSLDFFNHIVLLSRSELAKDLGLNPDKKWALLTFHPETKESVSYNTITIQNIISVLGNISGIEVIMTKANLDYGGQNINSFLEQVVQDRDNFKLFASLGQLRYFSIMKQVSFLIGNSSSGIVEAPFLSIPVINIGNRQKGRHQCKNIIQTSISYDDIQEAVDRAYSFNNDTDIIDKYYWGDGNSSKKILEILKYA